MNETSKATLPPTKLEHRKSARRAANKAEKARLRGRLFKTTGDPRVRVLSAEAIAKMPERCKKQMRRKAKAMAKFTDRASANGETFISRAIAR